MVRVSRVERDDLEQLSLLYEELVGKPSDMQRMTQVYEQIETNPRHILLVAKDDNGKVLGSVMGILCDDLCGDCRPFLVLENMVVSRECRGRGIGRVLIETIEAEARRHECYYSMLISRSTRKEAHAFYESMGYPLDAVQGFKKYF